MLKLNSGNSLNLELLVIDHVITLVGATRGDGERVYIPVEVI